MNHLEDIDGTPFTDPSEVEEEAENSDQMQEERVSKKTTAKMEEEITNLIAEHIHTISDGLMEIFEKYNRVRSKSGSRSPVPAKAKQSTKKVRNIRS